MARPCGFFARDRHRIVAVVSAKATSTSREDARMSDRLKGKLAFCTASGAGIGRATAVAFAREGAKVVASDLNEAAMAGLENVARQVPQSQGEEELLVQCLFARYAAQDAIARAVPRAPVPPRRRGSPARPRASVRTRERLRLSAAWSRSRSFSPAPRDRSAHWCGRSRG